MTLNEKLSLLPSDLKVLCQPGAKVYITEKLCFGNVELVEEDKVTLNVGSRRQPSPLYLKVDDFIAKLQSDAIVHRSRVKDTSDDGNMKVIPREPAPVLTLQETPLIINTHLQEEVRGVVTKDGTSIPVSDGSIVAECAKDFDDLEEAYLNLKEGTFSLTPKPDHVKILYKKVKTCVTLELDTVQLKTLKDMGILIKE
jgi:hypothetical protein